MENIINVNDSKRFVLSTFEKGETKGLNISMQVKTKKNPEWKFTNRSIFLNDDPKMIKALAKALKQYAKDLED